MTKEPAVPGEANITFMLGDEEVVLRPSLNACISISRLDNAPLETAEKINKMDFDTIITVLAVGMGIGPSKALREKVYKAGLIDIRAPLVRFIHVVNNGGRLPNMVEITDPEAEEAEGDEDPQTPSQSL